MSIAVTTPAANSSQSRRVRTHRTSSHVVATHSGVSIALVASSDDCSSRNVEVAYAPAVSACAKRPPPSSRAINADNRIPARVMSTEGSRNRISESPGIASPSSASSGRIGP